MALRIENVVSDIKTYMQSRYETELNDVTTATDTSLLLPEPRPENYFIGEPNQYKPYVVPAVFLVDNTTTRPGEHTADDFGIYDHQVDRLWLGIRIEERTEERLTKMCWRYARAADQCLHNAEVSTSADYTAHVYVVRVEYGAMLMDRDTNRFQKDVRLSLEIDIVDSLTMG